MNIADSERLASYYEARGFKRARNEKEADIVVINTCMVRQMAEDRIYGMVNNISKLKPSPKIIVTGCLVGTANREPSGRVMKYLKTRLPLVDEFLSMEEIGFEYTPKRTDKKNALLPISNGCNNMCAYCVVPWSRGREISRPFADIIKEAESLAQQGYQEITLLGQNVNSYGVNLGFKTQVNQANFQLPNGVQVKPVMVKSMGRMRIPTLFPYLLAEIAKIGDSERSSTPLKGVELLKSFKKINFISSNPWDFSDELIDVIAKYPSINREIHLPAQSGDNETLKKMNRWYTREEYLTLIKKIKMKIPEASFTTDIIVGFPGETEEQFQNTVLLCQQVNFNIAYISRYSPRPGTAAEKMADDVPREEKKRRFYVLDNFINKKIPLRPDGMTLPSAEAAATSPYKGEE